MIRTFLAAALSIALGACASTSQGPRRPAASGAPISSDAVQPAADPRVLMVQLATSMIGQPYRFGGAAPGGFDCSGLVVYSAGGAGIHVPRTAHQQLTAGKAVARDDLRAGDLVFMHLAHKELHVGIAIDAERFVHAPSKGGYVRIDSLGVPRYARGFIAARRIIAPL